MNCDEIKEQLVLYSYGEVSSAVEEQVEAHLEFCVECRAERSRHMAFLEALDQREDFTDPSLLIACRSELRAALSGGRRSTGWLQALRDFSRMNIPFRIPVGAMALVALGFFGARFAPEKFGGMQAGVAVPMFSMSGVA
jgi:hypothetical protein